VVRDLTPHQNDSHDMSNKTIEPVEPGNCAGVMPEFGRMADVRHLFGIRRGTAYNLLADGKIKGVLLRVRGQKSGVRLINLASVRAFIHQQSNIAQ
jgi:hypothetical protein